MIIRDWNYQLFARGGFWPNGSYR